MGHYPSLVEAVDDLNLMFENAKKYNRPDSKLFKVINLYILLEQFLFENKFDIVI